MGEGAREVCGEEVGGAGVGLVDVDAVERAFLGGVVAEGVPV